MGQKMKPFVFMNIILFLIIHPLRGQSKRRVNGFSIPAPQSLAGFTSLTDERRR